MKIVFLCFSLTGPADAVLVCSADDGISTEAEARTQTGRQYAVNTGCLVPLAVSAPVNVANG